MLYLHYTLPMAPKIGSVVAYNGKLQRIKQNPLSTWFYEVTKKIKYVVPPVELNQWSRNMTRSRLTKFWPIKPNNLLDMWPCRVTWQIKTIKCQVWQCLWSRTCQDGDIPTNNMLLSSRAIVRSHDKLNKLYIQLQVTYGTKLGKVVTYCKRLPSLN